MHVYSLAARCTYLLTALLTGLIAGLFFAFTYDVNIAFGELSGPEYAKNMELINVSIRNAVFGSVFFPSVVLPVVALALSWRSYRSPAFLLVLVGFLIYLFGSFLVTTQINIPLNYYLESWDIAAPPSDWEATRDSWNWWNAVRTWASIAAFACYLVALTLPVQRPGALYRQPAVA